MDIIMMIICIILIIASIICEMIGMSKADTDWLVIAWVFALVTIVLSIEMYQNHIKDVNKALIKDRKMEYRSNEYGDTQLYLLDSTMTNTFKEVLDD